MYLYKMVLIFIMMGVGTYEFKVSNDFWGSPHCVILNLAYTKLNTIFIASFLR